MNALIALVIIVGPAIGWLALVGFCEVFGRDHA